jgi:exodeoxyribonuclease V alpha subunit
MTVHKSQGSEYGNVLLVLPANRNHPLLTREIVYTGITRTRGNAFVFASEAALRGAVARRIERHSGIDLWSEGGEG